MTSQTYRGVCGFEYRGEINRNSIKDLDMDGEKMVSVGMRNDLQELKEFLMLGGEYLKGHPNDPDVIELRGALENVLANYCEETALAVIKRALREKSWFVTVLDEHQNEYDDVEFKRAMELCESLSTSLKFVTGDPAPDQSVTGRWEELPPIPTHDPESIPIWNELNKYSEIMCWLSRYIFHVESRLPLEMEDKLLPPACQDEVNKLKMKIKEFPTSDQQLRFFISKKRPEGTLLYLYHTSYVEFSRRSKFSRSALLANLPALMAQLHKCKKVCTITIPQTDSMDLHDDMYDSCQEAYKAWHALAVSQLQGSFRAAQVREWEQNGSKSRVDLSQQSEAPSMREMLVALRSLARDEKVY